MLTISTSMMASRPLPCAIEMIAEAEGFPRLRPEWDELAQIRRGSSLAFGLAGRIEGATLGSQRPLSGTS